MISTQILFFERTFYFFYEPQLDGENEPNPEPDHEPDHEPDPEPDPEPEQKYDPKPEQTLKPLIKKKEILPLPPPPVYF